MRHYMYRANPLSSDPVITGAGTNPFNTCLNLCSRSMFQKGEKLCVSIGGVPMILCTLIFITNIYTLKIRTIHRLNRNLLNEAS